MKASIRHIAICEPQTLIRKGLAALLREVPTINISVEAGSGVELLGSLNGRPSLPAVCLMHIRYGADAALIDALKQRCPDTYLMVMGDSVNEYVVMYLLQCGLHGYIDRNCTPADLLHALEELAVHHYYVPGHIQDKMNLYRQRKQRDHLTDAEMRFLPYCCSELSNKEVARLMNVSERTVHGYRDSLFAKLGVRTRTGLAMFAMQMGLSPQMGTREWSTVVRR